jgi:hypothetical protein
MGIALAPGAEPSEGNLGDVSGVIPLPEMGLASPEPSLRVATKRASYEHHPGWLFCEQVIRDHVMRVTAIKGGLG